SGVLGFALVLVFVLVLLSGIRYGWGIQAEEKRRGSQRKKPAGKTTDGLMGRIQCNGAETEVGTLQRSGDDGGSSGWIRGESRQDSQRFALSDEIVNEPRANRGYRTACRVY
ncbi:MAG: hypothetical protein AAFP69_05380, partial [Planctomycetota bacterium]